MLNSSIPTKTPTPWANGAGTNYIRTVPIASQIGITNGAASWTDGFPPLTFVQQSAGGYPPDGRDANYAINLLSQWTRWMQAGGAVVYDSTFSTNVSGYPANATINASTGLGLWRSTADNNTANPDTIPTVGNWVPVAPFFGYTLVTLAGTNVVLTPQQAASGIIFFTGTLTANVTVTFPAWATSWQLYNGTSGAFTITVASAGAGSSVTIPAGAGGVFSDGTNMILSITGYATTSYVSGNYVALAGSTMTGTLTVSVGSGGVPLSMASTSNSSTTTSIYAANGGSYYFWQYGLYGSAGTVPGAMFWLQNGYSFPAATLTGAGAFSTASTITAAAGNVVAAAGDLYAGSSGGGTVHGATFTGNAATATTASSAGSAATASTQAVTDSSGNIVNTYFLQTFWPRSKGLTSAVGPVTNSNTYVPINFFIGANGLVVGSVIRFKFAITSNNGSIAISALNIYFGTNGSTADTSAAFLGPSGFTVAPTSGATLYWEGFMTITATGSSGSFKLNGQWTSNDGTNGLTMASTGTINTTQNNIFGFAIYVNGAGASFTCPAASIGLV